MNKTVFVSGCFDMLHSGHIAFFSEAAKYGDLNVALGSDKTVFDLKGRLPVNNEYIGLVRQGMYEVVNGRSGTGKTARNGALSLAGKTGTAEVGRGARAHKDTWFIGFGPVEDPRYAIAVVVEGGDSGSRTAAPLAARFFEAWLGVPEVGLTENGD